MKTRDPYASKKNLDSSWTNKVAFDKIQNPRLDRRKYVSIKQQSHQDQTLYASLFSGMCKKSFFQSVRRSLTVRYELV